MHRLFKRSALIARKYLSRHCNQFSFNRLSHTLGDDKALKRRLFCLPFPHCPFWHSSTGSFSPSNFFIILSFFLLLPLLILRISLSSVQNCHGAETIFNLLLKRLSLPYQSTSAKLRREKKADHTIYNQTTNPLCPALKVKRLSVYYATTEKEPWISTNFTKFSKMKSKHLKQSLWMTTRRWSIKHLGRQAAQLFFVLPIAR